MRLKNNPIQNLREDNWIIADDVAVTDHEFISRYYLILLALLGLKGNKFNQDRNISVNSQMIEVLVRGSNKL